MAKKTHPITRLHKIKVHKNRWLAWAIAYAVIIAIVLIGYIKVSDINFETQNTDIIQSQALHNFRDQQLGFLVKYPGDWSIEANNNSSVTFVPVNSLDAGVSVSVMKSTDEKVFRKTLKISSETSVMLDGNPASRIVNKLVAGSNETVILCVYKNQLYILRWTDSLVQKLATNFQFISK